MKVGLQFEISFDKQIISIANFWINICFKCAVNKFIYDNARKLRAEKYFYFTPTQHGQSRFKLFFCCYTRLQDASLLHDDENKRRLHNNNRTSNKYLGCCSCFLCCPCFFFVSFLAFLVTSRLGTTPEVYSNVQFLRFFFDFKRKKNVM